MTFTSDNNKFVPQNEIGQHQIATKIQNNFKIIQKFDTYLESSF